MTNADRPEVSSASPPAGPRDEFEGSWEHKGRSPAAAAIVGLLGIGALYFNAQSILALLAFGVATAGHPLGDIPQGVLERMEYLIRLEANPLQAAIMASQYLFMLIPAWWIVRRWHTRSVLRYVRLVKTSPVDLLLAVGITLLMIPAGNFIANEFTRQLGIPDELLRINAELFTAHSPVEFIWMILVVAVTPAVCEEFFFRGYVQRTLERTTGWKSVIIVGVLFGLFHMQPLGLFTLAILGMLFGYFYYQSRSLLPGMLAHFTNNALAIGLLYWSPSGSGADAVASQVPLLWVGLTLPPGVLLLVLYHVRTARTRAT
jgi:membrane protease YdiL (CAAX protease family)